MEVGYLADHRQFIPTLACWHERERLDGDHGYSIRARIEKLTFCCGRRDIPTTFVAFDGGELLGSAMLIGHDKDGRVDFSPWLAGLVVSPYHRGRGIGTALISRAIAEAKVLGIATLHLYASTREEFYSRLGWGAVNRVSYRGVSVTVMSRAIQI